MTVQWDKVYVFISSTFNDMHAERDYLVKRVFPELQDWCEQRKLRLVDVDLRWGVTEEDATKNLNVVQTCLNRIDDCRPFFVCFLGQRYGWIPEGQDVSSETYKKFPGLKNAVENAISMTELEIMHAIVQPFLDASPGSGNKYAAEHSFFYLRDKDYLDEVPDEPPALRQIYSDADKDGELNRLKNEIIIKTGRPIHPYQTRWEPESITPELALPLKCPALLEGNVLSWQNTWKRALGLESPLSGREIPPEYVEQAEAYNQHLTAGRLTDFTIHGKPLSEILQTDLKTAIAERYPEHMVIDEKNDLQKELDQHEVFLFSNSEGFIERPGDFNDLDSYVAGDSTDLFVLTAEGGMGKSMLLAKWMERCRKNTHLQSDNTFHIRFIGQSDRSNTVTGLILYLLRELQEVAEKIPNMEFPIERQELQRVWQDQLGKLKSLGKTVIVIDALNQLESGMQDIQWLPLSGLPKNVKIIVSFRRGDPDTEDVFQRLSANPHVTLSEVAPFTDANHRKALVKSYLSQYLKELDEEHIDQLIASKGAGNPLFLKVVLSELRVFGSFQQLSEKIQTDFGEKPKEAFAAVLKRLEHDTVYSKIAPEVGIPLLFGLMLHSRYGLSPVEMTDLLQNFLNSSLTNRAEIFEGVQLILRQVKPFIGRRDNRYSFFFESFQIAVKERYISTSDSQSLPVMPDYRWHGLLADYFYGQNLYDEDLKANQRKLDELPYQQANAKLWDGLRETLTDFNFLFAKADVIGLESLLVDYENTVNAGYSDKDLPLILDALRLGAYVISRDVNQLPSQLTGRLMTILNPSIQLLVSQTTQWHDRSWLCPILAALLGSGTALQRTLSGQPGAVLSMALEPNQNKLFVGNSNHSLTTWDMDRCEQLETISLPTNLDNIIEGDLSEMVGMLLSGVEGGLDSLRGQVCFGPSAIAPIPGKEQLLFAIIRDKSLWIWDLEKQVRTQVLRGHLGMVYAIAVTQDGHYGISSSVDSTVRVWDLWQNAPVIKATYTLVKHRHHVTCIALSEDHQCVVSGGMDKLICIWDISKGKLIRSIRTGQNIAALTVSPDNKYIAILSTEGNMYVYNYEQKESGLKNMFGESALHILEGHGSLPAGLMAISNQQVVSASNKEGLRVWDLKVGNLVTDLAQDSTSPTVMTTMIVDHKHSTIITGGTDRAVKLWRYDIEPAATQTIQPPGDARCTAITPDGCLVIIGNLDGTIIVWDVVSKSVKYELKGHKGWVRELAIDQKGQILVSVGQETNVRVWDLTSGKQTRVLEGHTRGVNSVSITDDGQFALTGGNDYSVRLWNLKEGKQARVFSNHEGEISTVSISAYGEVGVSTSADGTFRILHLKELMGDMPDLLNTLFSSLTTQGTGNQLKSGISTKNIIIASAVSPDGQLAIFGDREGVLQLWNLEKRSEIYFLVNQGPAVWSLKFVHNQPHLCVCARGSQLEVWDIIARKLLATYTADAYLVSCDVTLDGTLVAATDSSGGIHILRLITGGRKENHS